MIDDDIELPSWHNPSVREIQQVICEQQGINHNELLSARRSRDVVRPRQMAMFIARNLTAKSLPEIGRMFGGRDHTTVIHAIRAIEANPDGDMIDDVMRAVVALAHRVASRARPTTIFNGSIS